jgi:hypothetical protein
MVAAAQRGDALHSTASGFVASFPLRLFAVCSPSITHGEARGRATMAISFKGAHFPKEVKVFQSCGSPVR